MGSALQRGIVDHRLSDISSPRRRALRLRGGASGPALRVVEDLQHRSSPRAVLGIPGPAEHDSPGRHIHQPSTAGMAVDPPGRFSRTCRLPRVDGLVPGRVCLGLAHRRALYWMGQDRAPARWPCAVASHGSFLLRSADDARAGAGRNRLVADAWRPDDRGGRGAGIRDSAQASSRDHGPRLSAGGRKVPTADWLGCRRHCDRRGQRA